MKISIWSIEVAFYDLQLSLDNKANNDTIFDVSHLKLFHAMLTKIWETLSLYQHHEYFHNVIYLWKSLNPCRNPSDYRVFIELHSLF